MLVADGRLSAKIAGKFAVYIVEVVFMPQLDRITFDPNVMGGKPCIRGMRVTIGTIVGLIASGSSHDEILGDYDC